MKEELPVPDLFLQMDEGKPKSFCISYWNNCSKIGYDHKYLKFE